jgi:hypothetical protein
MTMGMELQRAAARSAHPWRKKTGVCRWCGREFDRAGRPRGVQFCSDDCRDAKKRADVKRNARRQARKLKDERRSAAAAARVVCKCPRCACMHEVRMAPVRPGFTPRIYCPACSQDVENLRFCISHDSVLGAHAVGYY